MKSKEDLFFLIKAMSKSEKRYFTLDAQKGGRKGSKYLELFQAINAMEAYDEGKLKKKFPKNLASDKGYLYEAILRSMRDYRSVRSFAARIKELILDFKYLYERGLYAQADGRLNEAKELAAELDDQMALLELNREERTLVLKTRQDYDAALYQLIDEKEEILNKLVDEFRYLDSGYKLFIEIKRNPHLSEEERRQRIAGQIPSGLLNGEHPPAAPYARRLYYQCNALYAQLMGDHAKMLEYYTLVVDWWQENSPKFRQEEFYRYVEDIANLLNVYALTGKYQYIPDLVALLEKEEVTNVHDQAVVFQSATIYRLMYHINTGNMEGVNLLLEKIQHGLKTFNINMGTRMVILFNTAVLLFIKEDFATCIEWCRRITKGVKTNFRQDIQAGAHLLYLIAVFEVGSPEEIDSALRSVYRFFSQRADRRQEEFSYRVIEFLRRLVNAPVRESEVWMQQFQDYLITIQDDPAVKVPLGLNELLKWWVDSRLERAAILKMVQRRAPAAK